MLNRAPAGGPDPTTPTSKPAINNNPNKTTDPGHTQTGNLMLVKFGGKIVALLQSLDCADDYAPQPATTIGTIEAKEYVPTFAQHTLSASQMLLTKDTLYHTADGTALIPQSGDNANKAIMTALSGQTMEIQITTKDGKALCTYYNCTYGGGTTNISANRIVVSNATFYATHREGDWNITTN